MRTVDASRGRWISALGDDRFEVAAHPLAHRGHDAFDRLVTSYVEQAERHKYRRCGLDRALLLWVAVLDMEALVAEGVS